MICQYCGKRNSSYEDQIIKILRKNQQTPTMLRDALGCSFGSIAYVLKKLEINSIVKKTRDSSKRGCPTTYILMEIK